VTQTLTEKSAVEKLSDGYVKEMSANLNFIAATARRMRSRTADKIKGASR